jgi:hypothetical protein
MLLMMALASIGDYPIRTPIISCVFVIAILWMTDKPEGKESQRLIGTSDQSG